jgi:hypothetical protein
MMNEDERAREIALGERPEADTDVVCAAPLAEARERTRLKLTGGEAGVNLDVEPDKPMGPRFRGLLASIGADNWDLGYGLIHQIIDSAKGDDEGSNFALAAVQNIQPRDAVESMLAVQMAAGHMAAMGAARRLARADTLPKYEAYERAFTRLVRTFTALAEALKNYRSKGEQKVTVQHVNVTEGGRAIVGNVTR